MAVGERGPEHADDGAALEQNEIERKARNFPGGEAEHEIAAIPSRRPQARLRMRAADAVVDDVDALAAGHLLQPALQILFRIVDAEFGAMRARQSELLAGRGDGDDAAAHQFGDLNGGEACATGGAEHGDGLTFL